MEYIPVIHIQSKAPLWLPINEILFITVNNRKFEYYTFSGTYRNPGTIMEQYTLMNSVGFEYADRKSYLANLQNVTKYDKETRQVHFIHESGMTLTIEASRRSSKIFNHN
ncbi:hypothetical protein D3P09_02800 [Paenibacillus pinisoli]|uniref:HTH LytTR-type domain-containing protein n=1 Tax=Paenibacillus pinisoli TaxID=1276110 RepID=A0A3A6Q527_9BACL|nr:LytTR family transcriptional regulator DNA-binding domain-containing protein [Paenibacillus pinisoli]RJX40964.1 hypothetical protein D3P09_02800 [Paenibacillus pinisoli]